MRSEVRAKTMNDITTATIVEQATYYRTHFNWSVIPVGRNKKPLIDWKRYQEKLPTVGEITAWWQRFPNANIGIVTGKISSLVVIDIDPRHGGSNEHLKDYKTPVVKTGGGGWHYYFQYNEVLQTCAGIQPGIDIRSDGGYVIAPPSIHESGNKYEWEVEPQ